MCPREPLRRNLLAIMERRPLARYRPQRHGLMPFIPGDGIGTEVIAAGIQALESLARRDGGFALRFEHFDWGSNYYLKHGEMMPADWKDRIGGHTAILFGAVGWPASRCSARNSSTICNDPPASRRDIPTGSWCSAT